MRKAIQLLLIICLFAYCQSDEQYFGKWLTTGYFFTNMGAFDSSSANELIGKTINIQKDFVSFINDSCKNPKYSVEKQKSAVFFYDFNGQLSSIGVTSPSVNVLDIICIADTVQTYAIISKTEMYKRLDGAFFQLKPYSLPALKQIHQAALNAFKNKDKRLAASMMSRGLGKSPLTIDKSNVTIINDCGYFLEQAGKYKEALAYLLPVVNTFPNRTVAYLNLGDTYAGLNDTDSSLRNYKRYCELMNQAGKGQEIPERVRLVCK